MKSNRTTNSGKCFGLAAGALAAGLTLGAAATTYHVDGATGNDNNNGFLWSTPFKTVQKALSVANEQTDDVIWVAAGTYYPDEINGQDSNLRSDSFNLVDGVKIYGGFLNGDVFEDRDPIANETILSGDIDQNDGPNFANNDENSVNVDMAENVDPSVILDGFTITAGNANDLPGGIAWGAGINCRDFAASPTINRCIIKDNFAWVWGAGMYCGANSRAIISNCTFQGNVAEINESGSGAAVYCNRAAPAIIKCTFASNQARYDAGAIFVSGTSDPPEDLTITNCIFTNNQARRRGGAISVDGTVIPAEVAITNSLFADNLVQGIPGDAESGRGGAIYCHNGKMAVCCSTIVDNQAVEGGGVAIGLSFFIFHGMDIRDTILFGNVADGHNGGPPGNQLWVFIAGLGSIVLNVDYCDVQGGLADVGGFIFDGFWRDHNIDDDPLFVAPGTNYRLAADSPCIDVGDPDETVIPCDEFDLDNDGFDCDSNPPQPTPDLDLGDRIVGTDVDMGAYESVPCPADLNGDCEVGVKDLLIFLGSWGPCVEPCPPFCPADFDGDCDVGVMDLLFLLATWGPCPCAPHAEVLSLPEKLAEACVSEENWDKFEDKMKDPNASQAEKDNYYCWMDHHLFDCTCLTCWGALCPGPDPYIP